MAIKLLESLPSTGNEVHQQIDDGAIMNFHITHNLNGAIYGAKLTNTTNTISISAGLLMVRGFRLKIDSTTLLKTINSFPSANTDYYLYLAITRADNDASFSWQLLTTEVAPSLTQIERVEGTYYYKAAKATIGPSGIVGEIHSLIATIPAAPPVESNTTVGQGQSIPAPKIELIAKTNSAGTHAGMTGGVICVGNKHEYAKYTTNYTVKFVLYRYLQRGRMRNRSLANKVYTHKTGFVKSRKLGWKGDNSTMKLAIPINELQTVIVASKGSFQYKRSDVIDTVANVIDNMFYYQDPITDERQAITGENQPVAFIRSCRSKNLGLTRKNEHRHNFFRFAYRAELYDSSNKLVATSPLSASISIRPNRAHADLTLAPTGIGPLFRININ